MCATGHLVTLSNSHVIQRRKWVESVKADHTNSLTQHREAVERELSWLAQCRQSRFRAEDSRVRHLQDSVRNMSLLSDFSLDDSEGEEEEVRRVCIVWECRNLCVCVCVCVCVCDSLDGYSE